MSADVKVKYRTKMIDAFYDETFKPLRDKTTGEWVPEKVAEKWRHNEERQQRVLALPIGHTKEQAVNDYFGADYAWVECCQCGRSVDIALFFACDLTLCLPCIQGLRDLLERHYDQA